MPAPRVSVLIPCYGQARYLPEAIDAALAQRDADVEAIVVDDGSPDDAAVVAGRFVAAHPDRVRLVRQPNQGLAMARAAGLAVARGEFVVLLDADDLLEPTMAARCLAAFDATPAADLVVGNAWSAPIDGSRPPRRFDQEPVGWPAVLDYNPFGAVMAVMARIRSIRAAGGLAVEGLRACEDWDLWIRMLRCRLTVVSIADRLGTHREHPGSLGRDPLLMLDSKIRVLDWSAMDDPRIPVDSHPLPAIDRRAYARLRNAAVFHGFGLVLATDRAGLIETLATRLVPDALDVPYAVEQLVWGWRHGREAVGDDASLPVVPADRLTAALRAAGLGAHAAAVLDALDRRLHPRRDLAWLWRGVAWRVRALAARAGLVGAS